MKDDMLSKRLEAISKAKPVAFTPPKKPAPAPKNWRTEDRRSAYKFAKVYVNPETSLDCVILDMHSHGARLKLHGAPELPEKVVIVAPGIGLRKTAEVVWQHEDETGVKFVV